MRILESIQNDGFYQSYLLMQDILFFGLTQKNSFWYSFLETAFGMPLGLPNHSITFSFFYRLVLFTFQIAP